MKTPSTWVLRSIVGKIMMGLVLAAMVGSVNVLPAFGEDNRRHDKGRNEHRDRGHDRDRRGYEPNVYREGYYTPPPVIYAPAPEPGISIFLPIRR